MSWSPQKYVAENNELKVQDSWIFVWGTETLPETDSDGEQMYSTYYATDSDL